MQAIRITPYIKIVYIIKFCFKNTLYIKSKEICFCLRKGI